MLLCQECNYQPKYNNCKAKFINLIDNKFYCDICNLKLMNNYFKKTYNITNTHFYTQYNYKKEYLYNFVNNEEFRDYFFQNCKYINDYFKSENYKQKLVKQLLLNIEQELIEKTWHPNRFFNWCLDINEHKLFK
jgi:hypothetical protein